MRVEWQKGTMSYETFNTIDIFWIAFDIFKYENLCLIGIYFTPKPSLCLTFMNVTFFPS